MSKRRVALRLSDDEVAVVGPRHQWQYMVELFDWLAAENPEYQDQFIESRDWVQEWLDRSEPRRDEEDW